MSQHNAGVRLIAALTIASQSATHQAEDTFEQKLANIGRVLRGSSWLINVAINLKLRRLDLPWQSYRVRQLTTLLSQEGLSAADEVMASKLLARYCARIEFGVDVNAHWYGRLREIVIDGAISARELRALLRHSTVWWGTSVAASSNSSAIACFFYRLWSMGRPTAGELAIQQHHWFTKALVMAGLVLSGIASVAYGMDLLRQIDSSGVLDNSLPELVTMTMFYWGGLWLCCLMGPRSWIAASRLKRLLEAPDGHNTLIHLGR